MAFTLIFDGDIVGNPFATTTPHGTPNAIAVGNVIERNEELAHRIDRLEAALLEARRRLAKTRATWNVPCSSATHEEGPIGTNSSAGWKNGPRGVAKSY